MKSQKRPSNSGQRTSGNQPLSDGAVDSRAPGDRATVGVLRRVMPDWYFINTPAAHMQRHLDLLARLRGDKSTHKGEVARGAETESGRTENVVLDFHRHPGAVLTELTLCAYDDLEPGLLSKVCGTLSALRIDIRTAFIYTLREPPCEPPREPDAEPPHKPAATMPDAMLKAMPGAAHSKISEGTGAGARWVALDVLLLSEPYRGHERALTEKTIRRVRETLTEVLQGRRTVMQLLARAHSPAAIYALEVSRHVPAAVPASVSKSGSASDAAPRIASDRPQPFAHTQIRLRAQDAPGLLHRTTAALAALGLNIRVAQINTFDDVTEDLFFVTDARGHALSEAEGEAVASRLRAILQGGALAQLPHSA